MLFRSKAFVAMTALVIVVAFLGLLLALFLTLSQRKRELAIIRTLGGRPKHLFFLLILESGIITCLGVFSGIGLMIGVGTILTPVLESKLGLMVSLSTLTLNELFVASSIIGFGILISTIPAFQAYRKSITESIQVI